LPWLSAILLTDIFCGLGVLALYLLLLRAGTLSRAERIGLIVLAAVAASTHSATMAVLLALLAAAALGFLIDRSFMPARGLGRGLIALVLGAVLVLSADLIVAKRLAWTPGGFALSFGRMLQDGIVKRYLNDHCPDATLRLCAYKDQLPDDADVWFWGSDLFDRLGRFAGLGPEMTRIALGSIAEYPGMQVETAAVATARQLIDVHSGEGVRTDIWHTYAIIERFTPWAVPGMRAARQQTGGIDFTPINRLHYPIALLSMALLPLIVFAARRKWVAPDIGALAAAAIIALLANAFVCGALSNPHDRYGARMVWLATFVIVLAVASAWRQRRDAACGILPAPFQASN
jgi:hypothetical protein